MLQNLSLACLLALCPTLAFAWGSRGHAVICRAAVDLTPSRLKAQLTPHRETLAALCNAPDTVWRANESCKDLLGPTHFFDTEYVAASPRGASLDLATHLDQTSHAQLGSLWWRAEQLLRLAASCGDDLACFLTHAGTAAHFTGDASVPFHNTKNFDGRDNGHTGIHAYFETELVEQLPAHLESLVTAKARALSGALPKSPLALMRAVSDRSFELLPELFKIDQKNGRNTQKDLGRFSKILITQLALGARATADAWTLAWSKQIFKTMTTPQDLTHPEIVIPNYLPQVELMRSTCDRKKVETKS